MPRLKLNGDQLDVAPRMYWLRCGLLQFRVFLAVVFVCLASHRRVFCGQDGLAAELAVPISLHPDNPHYFIWRGKPTVLITSGEHYGLLLNLDFDFVAYFKTLQADGLNHTRVFSGTYRETPGDFNITDNTLGPQPNRYICPWQRSDTPGYFDGGNKFDLTEWDDAYFKRLKRMLSEARQRGIVVEFNLFCPMYRDRMWEACPMNAANNVNHVGQCQREEVYALKHPDLTRVQMAVTRKIVRSLRDFDNLYYEVCNEPYFGGVTMEWQHRIIDTIVDEERDFPTKHLISMNIANGKKKVASPHPAVSIFNFHYCVPPETIALNFGLNRVIGENETGFRGSDDVLYRTEAWDFLLAGGGLFNNLDYSFTANHPHGTFREYKSPGGGSTEYRKQLGILKRFLYDFEFVRMKPDNSVIQAVSPNLTATALVDTGKAYAIYLHIPLPKKPKDLSRLLRSDIHATVSIKLPPGHYTAKWIDTKNGSTKKSETFQHNGGTRKLQSPPFDNDAALSIKQMHPFSL